MTLFMQNHQDYLPNQGIGIRVHAENCQAIRKVRQGWREIGPVYRIPIDARLLNWIPPGIPPGVVAVALRQFELQYPGTRLRCLLTMNDAHSRRLAFNHDRYQKDESAA
jgi:hypothetical protein